MFHINQFLDSWLLVWGVFPKRIVVNLVSDFVDCNALAHCQPTVLLLVSNYGLWLLECITKTLTKEWGKLPRPCTPPSTPISPITPDQLSQTGGDDITQSPHVTRPHPLRLQHNRHTRNRGSRFEKIQKEGKKDQELKRQNQAFKYTEFLSQRPLCWNEFSFRDTACRCKSRTIHWNVWGFFLQ